MKQTPDRWEKIEQLYHAALKRPERERASFLQQVCTGDDALRREVESLLAQPSHAGQFLETPAAEMAARKLAENQERSLVGHQLGSFKVLSLLGAGGMGEVYEAQDTKLGRRVAIKILPWAFAHDPDRMSRFQREAKLLAAMNHPNIATIYGLEESGGVHYLVMELVAGQTLAERIRKGVVPPEESLRIAGQIAEALEAAHERGVIHRDLKPANVKVTPEGRVKVLDFGLAKAFTVDSGQDLSQGPTLSEEGRILGTPAYMSPEQARGRPVDKRTDIWAFGCVLYEILTGSKAFVGDTMPDSIAAILGREPVWHEIPETVPVNIRRLLRRCLEKDSRRRLRDIGDAVIELNDAVTEPEVAPSIAPAADQSRSRKRWVWSLAAVLTLSGVVAILVLGRGRVLRVWPGSNTAPTFTRITRLTSGPALEYGPAISPDGKWVAYLSNVRGPVDLWVKFVTGGEAINLTATASIELPSRIDIGGLTISPDGATIAFDAGSTKGTPANLFDTWVIPAPLGGVPRKLIQRGRSLRWSPDGKQIAYIRAGASAGDALLVAGADGSNPHEIVPTHGGMHVHWPAWSRDGRYLYFIYTITTSNSEPSSIYRVSAAGGPVEPVVLSERRAVFPSPTPDGRGLVFAANPLTSDLGLWWKSLNDPRAKPQPLANGVGEYAEPSFSADGRKMIATLIDFRQDLVALPTGPNGGTDVVRPLTDGYGGDLDPTLSPQGDRLLFSSARSGNRNLWIARPDGSNARPLTFGAAIDERPSFSPDGRRVAFVSGRNGERGIWVMNADGGEARQVVKAQVLDSVSWSPDGKELVYSTPAGDAPGLSIVNVSDSSVRRLPTPGPSTSPVWSPRSGVIAYVEARRGSPDTPSSSRVAFINAKGESVRTDSPQSPNVLNGFLVWSPDSRQLAAVVDPGATPGAVWTINFDGREPWKKLIEFPAGTRLRGAAWSPDGKSLIVGQIHRTSDIVLFERPE
jgi:Tol biopolymer transport system component